MPECDAVISFNHALTSRELQQRRGRARAPNSAYVSMLPRGNREAVEGQMNLNQWNLLVDQLLNGAGGLLIAATMKYADAIVKCFANALAIIVSTLLSVPLFGFHMSDTFLVGGSGIE